jgi:hypothetical protein
MATQSEQVKTAHLFISHGHNTMLNEQDHYLSIDEVADYIGRKLIRYGRVNVVQTKEKFGTARVYCNMGWSSLHSITHPGHFYIRHPKWLAQLDNKIFSTVIPLFNFIVVPYHKFLYRQAYKMALKKWPNLWKAILFGADYQDLLKGLHKEFDQIDRNYP